MGPSLLQRWVAYSPKNNRPSLKIDQWLPFSGLVPLTSVCMNLFNPPLPVFDSSAFMYESGPWSRHQQQIMRPREALRIRENRSCDPQDDDASWWRLLRLVTIVAASF